MQENFNLWVRELKNGLTISMCGERKPQVEGPKACQSDREKEPMKYK